MQTKSNTKTVRDLKDIKSLYDQIKASQVNSKPLNISLPSKNNSSALPDTIVDKTIAIYIKLIALNQIHILG